MRMRRPRVSFPLIGCLLGLCLGCSSPGTDQREGGAAATARPARLSLGVDSRLSIGDLPVFPYDGRGGSSVGEMIDLGDGRAALHFPAQDMHVPPLAIVPGLPEIPVRVEILPRDLVGVVDFCTGAAELSFDAVFQPVFFDTRPSAIAVVTDLTTGRSTGAFREVTGEPLDTRGSLRLVGVARVPLTGDPLVDGLLRLPTDAVCELQGHLDFPEGRFSCPGAPPPGPPARVFMEVGKEGRLSISHFPTFAYDGKGSGGYGLYSALPGGRAAIEFTGTALEVPPLFFIPGFDAVRIEITVKELAGEIHLAGGRIDLAFDAEFTPVVFGRRMTSISVVTPLTTETSSGMLRTLEGRRMDEWGDAYLVGVAVVPVTEDPLINAFLDLPTDAACELPVHLDFVPDEVTSRF